MLRKSTYSGSFSSFLLRFFDMFEGFFKLFLSSLSGITVFASWISKFCRNSAKADENCSSSKFLVGLPIPFFSNVIFQESLFTYQSSIQIRNFFLRKKLQRDVVTSCRAYRGVVLLFIEQPVKYICYCSLKLILLSGMCGHKHTLSCKKVSKAYTVISFVSLSC